MRPLQKLNARQKRTVWTAVALLTALALAITPWLPIWDRGNTEVLAKKNTPAPTGTVVEIQSSAKSTKTTPNPKTATPSQKEVDKPDNVVLQSSQLIDTRNAHIAVPELVGFADAKLDTSVNAKIRQELQVDALLARAEALSADAKSNDWELSLRFEAERIGQVYHIACYSLQQEPGGTEQKAQTHLHIDAVSGAFYQLDDLFTDAASARTVIAQKIDGLISAKSDEFLQGALAQPLPASFSLQPTMLVVYYPAGSISSAAKGFAQFSIPFADLSTQINKEGAFWKSLTTVT